MAPTARVKSYSTSAWFCLDSNFKNRDKPENVLAGVMLLTGVKAVVPFGPNHAVSVIRP